MSSKLQKILLSIFAAMFFVPEILLFTTPSSILSIANNFSEMNIKIPISYLINYQFFVDNPIYPLLIIVVEWVGILGLFILSIKSNKKILAILLGAVLLWLSFILFVGYVVGISMKFS